MKKNVMKEDADGKPKLHVVDDKPPIVIKREPVEYSDATRANLWRVMLEGCREKGGIKGPDDVMFYRRRSRLGVVIPTLLALGLGALYVYQVVCN